MKFIINRKTGKKLSYDEAFELSKKLSTFIAKDDIVYVKSINYPSDKLAKKMAKTIVDDRPDYILGFSGIEKSEPPKTGYSAIVIAFKFLPKNFESIFHNHVVIG